MYGGCDEWEERKKEAVLWCWCWWFVRPITKRKVWRGESGVLWVMVCHGGRR